VIDGEVADLALPAIVGDATIGASDDVGMAREHRRTLAR
jgi:hypothetical protein